MPQEWLNVLGKTETAQESQGDFFINWGSLLSIWKLTTTKYKSFFRNSFLGVWGSAVDFGALEINYFYSLKHSGSIAGEWDV